MDQLCRLYFMTDTVLGYGALDELASAMRKAGMKRPLLVSDHGIEAAGILAKIEARMAPPAVATFLDTPPNPTREACLAGGRLCASSEADGVVAVGGGSAIDLAKAVLVFATHDGAFEDYDAISGGTERINGARLLPLIVVPTTAGTGSEVGQSAVISVPGERKYILRHPAMKPRVSISDPELTLGLPRAMTVGSGMDALTHCIEGYLSPRCNPPAEAVALDGLARIWSNIERAATDGTDRDARWNMMLGSAEGGMAMTNGLGSVHALSHAAGGLHELNLHHGTLNALFLPDVLRFNMTRGDVDLEPLAAAAGCTDGAAFIEAIEALNGRLGVPASLAEMGVPEDRISALAWAAKSDFTDATNACPLSADDYRGLLEAQFGNAA